MSWSIVAAGKPLEIGRKVRGALAVSRALSGHARVFDALEGAVDAAVEGMKDSTDYPTSTTERTVIVESSGHIDGNHASVTLSIKTGLDFVQKQAE